MNKPEGLRQVELRDLSLRDLQAYGMKNPATLGYRKEVASRIAESTGSAKAFLYDRISGSDTTPWRINNRQEHERAILPGLLMAAGFKEGAATVVAGLPTKAEIQSAGKLKKLLEGNLGKKINYEILFEHRGKIIDLMTVNNDKYNYINYSFTEAIIKGDKSHFEVDHHAKVIKDHIHTAFLSNEKALIIPFVRGKEHDDIFVKEIESGRAVLHNIPDMDKAHNTLLLRERGFTHLPEMIIVGSNGKIIESHKELLSDEIANKGREKNPENISTLAKGVLKAIKRLRDEKGLNAYVILDPDGAAGSGNLDPEIGSYAKIYDNKVESEVKQKIMEGAIDKMFKDTLPPRSIIAEFIEPEEREGEKMDYTTRGQLVGGVWLPCSVSLIGTTKAKYNRQWTTLNPEAIGEDPDVWKKMLAITAEAARIVAEDSGYKTGDFGLDIFKRKDGSLAVHDFNYRRGGASAPEAVLPFLPNSDQVLFKARVEIPIPEMSFVHRVALYGRATDELFTEGIIPSETSSKNDVCDGLDAQTFTVIMLTDRITGPDGEQLPKNQHYGYAEMKVREAMRPERKIIPETIYPANPALYNY